MDWSTQSPLHLNARARFTADTPTFFTIICIDQPRLSSFRIANTIELSPIPVCLTVPGLRAILRPMRVLSVLALLTALILPTIALAEVQTFTSTHTYTLGDHDSKDDV